MTDIVEEQAKIVDNLAEANLTFDEYTFNRSFVMEETKTFLEIFRAGNNYNPTLIYMNSNGGSVIVAAAMLDALISADVPITIISELSNVSMGAIFPHGHDFIRLCYPHSFFVYHQVSYSFTGTYGEVDDLRRVTSISVDRWYNACKKSIGLTDKEWKKFCGDDTTIFGYEALTIGEHGMVDGLVIKNYNNGNILIKTRDGNKLINVCKHRRGDIKNLPVVTE